MVELLEILGMRYATSKSKKKKRYCKCMCECGKEFETLLENVKAGATSSCGCLRVKPKTHGLTRHPYYKKWVSMRLRCTNPKDVGYIHYGARGIKVFNEWLDNPIKYIEYISKLPKAGTKDYSIDRINNDGNYEPGNLRWATDHEQNSNTRRNTIKQSGEAHITWYSKTEKWRVRLEGKQIGSFKELPDAVEARDRYIKEK